MKLLAFIFGQPLCMIDKTNGGPGLRLYDGSDVKLKSVGWYLMLICSWTHRGST